ncbi:hypothetical protein BDE40_1428 [Litoreibacter halocynthiae]|uniref:Membrane protein YjdF n=1 Tax=Litoreibacter halocynthiae TaxID=1242689 RepID=A0A4R7LTF1_9RHOB|nr:hypothetical protein [Litoreibacter halocynthiae]TDT78122.1 hypothetical protein BDE40_1428 [Litoreibacter halocynthiae]
MAFSLKNQSPVLLLIWGLLLAVSLIALVLGRYSMAFVSFATFGLSLAPNLLASRFKIALPVPFVVAITMFLFATVFLGEAFDFYGRFWWWDIALHGTSAIGFGLTGFLFAFMLFEGDRFAAPHWALALIAFSIAMTTGALWEVFEFTMDSLFGLNMQKTGLDDTMGDLIVDAIGGALGSFAGYLYLTGSDKGLLAQPIRQFVALNRRLYLKSRNKLRK